MYEVTKVVTSDGKMFDTEKEAKAHIDRKYTELVCRIASKVLNIPKYQEMKVFLEENCELFEEMLTLKRELDEGVVD